MLDFVRIATRPLKKGIIEIYPNFVVNNRSTDLMIRGGDFYAIWMEEKGLWSTDEQDAIQLIDEEVVNFMHTFREQHPDDTIIVKYLWDSTSGMIDAWHKYCQKQLRDNYHSLDETLIFSDTKTSKKDYASKRLDYPLKPGEAPGYEKLISTLYAPEERKKIEWAIGSIVTGESRHIQKFLVLYGDAGTGKSTILNIVSKLFKGYCSVFDAKALGSSSNSFALEAFRSNPLVAIQHDGDLSKIEDNTRLNSLVSHELMTVNEKFKSAYTNRFNAFLFMGTNKPVKITDGKSGLIRRLIDVFPSKKLLPPDEYENAMKLIDFELGAIACHCRDVYSSDPRAYDKYIPMAMMSASNDFYNFMIDSFSVFKREDGTSLKAAWEMYNQYCDDARVSYPFSKRVFKEELKSYFWKFSEDYDDDSKTARYIGFRVDRFERDMAETRVSKKEASSIVFMEQPSVFDTQYADCCAQYASAEETPKNKWAKVHTKLSDLDTRKLHYVKVPINLIVIDFDLKDANGNKSFDLNLEAASKWPTTYAELSKSGAGIHLHYIYDGDPSLLNRVYDNNIEIKVFAGDSSLRRQLTKCNNSPITHISSGLPMKKEGGTKMLDVSIFKNERALRTIIKKNLNKEYHADTRSSIDFINKTLNDAYGSGVSYDVSDMKNAVYAFAFQSTNQSDYCMRLVQKMKFKSEDLCKSDADDLEKPLVFFDCEVFPNLLLINWKIGGVGKPIVRMINPRPQDVEELLRLRLVGFNCRRYDNHILYAAMLGYTNQEIYELSQKIINSKKGEKNVLFGEAYNLSYTDIYDFASAGNKKSLKKLEIEMTQQVAAGSPKIDGNLVELLSTVKHHELGIPWDQPVPESRWNEVAEYCDSDVLATEAAFYYLSADWTARQILADLAGATVNDTTNTLTTRIIFGSDKTPQNQFMYRDLSKPVEELPADVERFLKDACPAMMAQKHDGHGTGPAISLLPYFPGYRYENGISIYRGDEVGEGGYVYAEPGMYGNVALLDVSSMHPHSAIAECLFGVKFTQAYRDIVEGRVSIKHEAWNEVNSMLDGKLTPYIERVKNGEMTSKDLANALKTAINSVYGLTSAGFDNSFRDIRNKDNIVAKRGALFMVDLKNEVQKRGFTVAHIKTDSIKIPDATPEIIKFVMDFGQKYGYTFEHEATYDRMCLVNHSVYIAKYKDPAGCEELYGYAPSDNKKHANDPWTATGKQFAVPYVFKTLFSKEEIRVNDMCETFSVKSALYLDMNENLPDVSEYEELKTVRLKYPDWTQQGIESIKKADKLLVKFKDLSDARLDQMISDGHDRKFVGKVGEFCPIKPGRGGGILVREQNGKYYAATGTTGYRWLESDMVISQSNIDVIDRSYYDTLVNDAVDAIAKYGDFEWFVSDDPYISKKVPMPDFMNIPEDADDELPFV